MSAKPRVMTQQGDRRWRRTAFELGLQVLSRIVGKRLQRQLDVTRIRNIIVLQVQNVGDSVAFTPALRAIRRRFPNARIDLLCSPISAEFYAKCPHVDNVLLDHWFHPRVRELGKEVRLIRRLRATRYDLAICDASEISASHALAALLTGASMRVGFNTQNRGFLYTSELEAHPDVNFIEDNLTIAAALEADELSRDVECYFDERDDQYARRLIPPHDGKPLVAIHPVSNWQSKTWLAERWASLADALITSYGATVVFVGTAGERDYIDAVRARMSASASSIVGATTLSQLGAFLSHCALFIGTDSGPRHIAAGSRRPQVTLMSSQDYRNRWDFRRPNETILRTDPPCSPCFQAFCSHRRCMVEISEQMVLTACSQKLATATPDDLTAWPSAAVSVFGQPRDFETGS